MAYHYSRTLEGGFDEAVDRITESLKAKGFGVLSDIDVAATLHKKLDVDFHPYRILGACNPRMAHKALELEDKIGTMLPCNVIVQEHAPGRVEISAVDPVASMQAIDNQQLADVAGQVRDMLREAVDAA